jgi:hypothetical protein
MRTMLGASRFSSVSRLACNMKEVGDTLSSEVC